MRKYKCNICGKPLTLRDVPGARSSYKRSGYFWEHRTHSEWVECLEKWKEESEYYRNLRGIEVRRPRKKKKKPEIENKRQLVVHKI